MGGNSGSRASTEPVPVSALTGFDPGRMSDPWQAMVADACDAARREADMKVGAWLVDGARADNLGAQAMQLIADRTGLAVVPTGPSDYHEGKTFTPAQGIEARQRHAREAGHGPEDESPVGEADAPND